MPILEQPNDTCKTTLASFRSRRQANVGEHSGAEYFDSLFTHVQPKEPVSSQPTFDEPHGASKRNETMVERSDYAMMPWCGDETP
jgi:hypothetical protein